MITNSVLPPWITDAIFAVKRRRHDPEACELSGERSKRCSSPPPGRAPPAKRKATVARHPSIPLGKRGNAWH